MAEEKKESNEVVFLNRGQRHYDLNPDAQGKVRRHSPGTTMLYSAEEAKKAAGYFDLVDISKLPGQVDTNKLKAESAALHNENASLKAQLAALQTSSHVQEATLEPEAELVGAGKKRK